MEIQRYTVTTYILFLFLLEISVRIDRIDFTNETKILSKRQFVTHIFNAHLIIAHIIHNFIHNFYGFIIYKKI